MPHIKLQDFSGIVPRTGPTQLAPNEAQIARNVRVTSRELRGWRDKVDVYTPATAGLRSIYKLYNTFTGDTRWLEWATDVDVVRGPVADDNDFRVYYTGDGLPKKTNWNLATNNGSTIKPFPKASLNMGVPAPTGAPTLSATGGSGGVETRAYVYTNVSTFGAVKEESAPSPATNVDCNVIDATVTVSGFTAAPTTGYNITHRRIYRTVTGAATVSYQLVVELPVATSSYDDTKTVVQLGSLLQTTNWNTPPDDLKGIVSMANGMLVAFRKNEVWFCEPYYPHAWPDVYTLTVDSEIVGLGVYDTSVVVLTKGQPYLMTGSNPLSISQSKLPLNQPCVSKRSIASDQYGVLYASPNGLVSIGSGTQDVVTLPLYTRQEWQELNPDSMLGAIYNNMYIGFCEQQGSIQAIVISRADTPPLIVLDFDANALHIDRRTSEIFAVSNIDNHIYQLDADLVNLTFYEWLSKKFILPNPMNFGAFKVHGDFDFITDGADYNAVVADIVASNQQIFTASGGVTQGMFNNAMLNTFVLNGSLLQPIPQIATTRSVNVFIYGDGQEVWSGGVVSPETIRLPGGFKAYTWEVRITGNTPVRAFAMATSVAELREVMG